MSARCRLEATTHHIRRARFLPTKMAFFSTATETTSQQPMCEKICPRNDSPRSFESVPKNSGYIPKSADPSQVSRARAEVSSCLCFDRPFPTEQLAACLLIHTGIWHPGIAASASFSIGPSRPGIRFSRTIDLRRRARSARGTLILDMRLVG